jgi:hypothetical protein
VDCLNHARYVQPRRTTGSPNGREPQGDGEPIVVVGSRPTEEPGKAGCRAKWLR